MQVQQIKDLMNNVTQEILGKTGLVAEDLSNVVDLGKEIFDNTAIDNYVKSLVNHIGRVIFVNRPYSGSVPSMLMDGWEFGSVLEKIQADIPAATENESWKLTDGTSYDPNVFYQPKVSAKFFNSKVTFEVPMSFTELQVKESFSNAEQLNGFLSMIYSSVDKSMSIKIDSLIMRTINNMIAQTYNAEVTGEATAHSGIKAVNLLKKYNDATGANLTIANQPLYKPEFIRYASMLIGQYKDRMSKISTLFNVGGKERFTPADMLNIVLLSDFKNAAIAYLESDTFHNDLIALPNAETVPFWQGSGTSYAFTDTSKINVTIKTNDTTKAVEAGGIVGVMYDRDSMGVCNTDRRVTTYYNAKAEFYNNYYKFDASYFNDLNENFVVFFIA